MGLVGSQPVRASDHIMLWCVRRLPFGFNDFAKRHSVGFLTGWFLGPGL